MAGKKPQRGLGRGLGALLGEDVVSPTEEKAADEVLNLEIRLIDPNREQPRRDFDEEALQELAASIQAVGVIQPIIVCREGERYTIVAGERRYRAARLAGLEQIPAIVRDWEKQTRLEAALIENLQRDDLNPVEEAMGVKKLMEETGLTQEQAAQRLGKSRPAVANLLRLLTLPESVIRMLREGKLTAGHARALVGLEKGKQEKLAQLCAAQGTPVPHRHIAFRDGDVACQHGFACHEVVPAAAPGIVHGVIADIEQAAHSVIERCEIHPGHDCAQP